MKTLIILLFIVLASSLSSCSPIGLIYQGSTTEGVKPILVNSPQYKKKQKARWKYKAKRIKRNANANY